MYLAEHQSGLGFAPALITAGTSILNTIAQDRTLKTQVKGAKIGLQTVQEQRAAMRESGAQTLARDKLKIVMVGVGSLAALGVAYFAFNRRGRS